MKYPDWTRKPTLEAAARPDPRRASPIAWPLSGRSADTRTETSADGERITKRGQIDYGSLITKSALPEGIKNKPLAGLIYFPYDGKLKSIRTVELLIDETVLKLR